jgi:hypothetical protein
LKNYPVKQEAKMTHTNRGRIAVEIGDKWRLYTNTIPAGAEVIGTVSRDGLADIGALVRFSNGNFAQINDGSARRLDKRKVAAALETINQS